jgi:TrmH family RNA methyltransferase
MNIAMNVLNWSSSISVFGRWRRQTMRSCTEKRGKDFKYTEEAYLMQSQSVERAEWAERVREATSQNFEQDGKRRTKQKFWTPSLDPPPLLTNVVVVLVSPRRPVSVGTVARALSCFECAELRIVDPRCDHLQRNSKSASKGAQYLLHNAKTYETVKEAVSDVDLSVAFTRWTRGRSAVFLDLPALTAHPVVKALVEAPVQPSEASKPTRMALIFGREELGLSDEEVDSCSAVCSIPIGRLQESLSLSHAVTISLSALYSLRLSHLVRDQTVGSAYQVTALEGLAEGFDSSEGGTEH